MTQPPLVVDIDGTLTHPQREGIDPRVFDRLAEWPAPVVVATGKSAPYPTALCQFLGLPERVIAETGGMVITTEATETLVDPTAVDAVKTAYREAGYNLGWGDVDLVNRWRETELAVARDRPREPLERIAEREGFEIVDTGYAYHVKHPAASKGRGLETIGDLLDIDPEAFVAIGDSDNDITLFETAGYGFAVANAAERAKAAADEVLEAPHATGTIAALERIAETGRP